MSPDEILKLNEVNILEPVRSKRVNDQEFDFTFSINSITDPKWREIYTELYGDGAEKIKFHGSELTFTCRPTELKHEMPKVKLTMISTNENYQKARELLDAKIKAQDEEAAQSVINKNLEDEEVTEMFKNFKV